MNKLHYLLLFTFIYNLSVAQLEMFSKTDLEVPLLTESYDDQITLSLNLDYFASIKNIKPCDIVFKIPFFNNSSLDLNIESFDSFTNDFQLLRSTASGMIEDEYQPDIQSYRIIGDNMSGSISFMKHMLIGVIKYNGNVYEIQHIENNLYVLFDVNKSTSDSNFSCQTNTDDMEVQNTSNQPVQGGGECVEMGIEIDHYTYLEFNSNCYDAVEWALALLAGVSEVYSSELNDAVFLQARYINVWEIIDNYDPLDDCGDMLDEMPNYWNNPPFSDIYAQTDLVHLFTRKPAGGGIAFVGAFCGGLSNANWGFGVTSGLNATLTYSYPDNTPYSYNLSYLGHEIGHNFGSNHTHNCGWDADSSLNFPGGAIDGCADVEGGCTSPLNPPNEIWQQSLGTIMSYCDLGSVGITLEFHPIVVSQALIPGVNNANCLNICDDIETSCGNSVYGCTNEIAENYNPQANIDDNSCEYIYGCMSPNADNYNINATLDDGSCICSGEINLYIETDYYSNETGWELLDSNGTIIDSSDIGSFFQGGVVIDNTYCLSEGCYDFNLYDEWGDGISSENTAGNTPNYYITYINGEYLVDMDNVDFGEESLNPFCIVICDGDVDEDGVCDEDEVYGCTNDDYLEYNSIATEDDNSCITLIVEGCLDIEACNYNDLSNVDDNSCEYPAVSFDCDGDCISDIDSNGLCDIFGCMNTDACNYNSSNNIDDGTCEFPNFNFDCDGNCLVTIDCAGECGGSAIYDECNVCSGDNTTCLGCIDDQACNFDNEATLDDNSCEFPDFNFDCNDNCIVDIDCAGECGGNSVYDECDICGGSGPEEFLDCNGTCLADEDLDGVCDQIDNCIEDYNPLQIDNDLDGYGDECSCQYIDLLGQIIVEAGSYEIYTLSSNIDNTSSWQVEGGEVVWNSATDPSVGIQWSEIGEGTISIVQYFGINQSCIIDLNITVIPSSIDLEENISLTRKLIIITDLLGREIDTKNNHHCLLYIYSDGSVEKIYQIK
jgi:hypothetical protein